MENSKDKINNQVYEYWFDTPKSCLGISLNTVVFWVGIFNILTSSFNLYAYGEPLTIFPYLDTFSKIVIPLYFLRVVLTFVIAVLSIISVMKQDVRLAYSTYRLSLFNSVYSLATFGLIF